MANYLWQYLNGTAALPGPGGYAAHFQSVISDPAQALVFFALVMIATIAIVAAGVERGIERACTLLMPVFVLLLVSLSGYGLSLDGAGRAMSFMFMPDWDALRRPTTYLAAIGQAFFFPSVSAWAC